MDDYSPVVEFDLRLGRILEDVSEYALPEQVEKPQHERLMENIIYFPSAQPEIEGY